MSGLGCNRCRDTGAAFDSVEADPYGPVPRYRTQRSYCTCVFGDALRAKEAREVSNLRALNDAARAWADEHMTPPPEEDRA